ncbi:hypothetical protein [Caulobacter sp. X]|uniref:hypothetical protein n=1 Tax=Caulobacter sp. X TaxID=2048901 RepID=UPI000C161578|nr:hypothetical protein [Caulobacter sp. X]PIB96494.1 hypothetical protein CSW60_18475 [Caulobacter sp. X]
MSGGDEKAARKLDRQLLPENYEVARRKWAAVCHVVADHESVPAASLRFAGGGETRAGPDLIRARRFSCYLALTAAELSSHALANVSKLTRKTIREHARAVEDSRDDPAVSAELDALTAEIQLVVARREFIERRRQAMVDSVALQRPAWRPADPAYDALIAAWARAERATEAWRAMLAADNGGVEAAKPSLTPPSDQKNGEAAP